MMPESEAGAPIQSGDAGTHDKSVDSPWRTVVAESVEEYVALVFEHTSPSVSFEPDYLNLFRGQSSIEWPLLPKLYRRSGMNNLYYRNLEEIGLARFTQLSFPFRDWQSDGTWHHDWFDLFVAHHYGLVTRLLDWTSNPLAALWFAVSSASPEDTVDGVVYFLNTEGYDIGLADTIKKASPFDSSANGLYVFGAPGISKRITAQDSYFTSHSCDLLTGAPLRIETEFNEDQRMLRVRIPGSQFEFIRHRLNQLSVNEYRVFPDLGGVARHVNWIESD